MVIEQGLQDFPVLISAHPRKSQTYSPALFPACASGSQGFIKHPPNGCRGVACSNVMIIHSRSFGEMNHPTGIGQQNRAALCSASIDYKHIRHNVLFSTQAAIFDLQKLNFGIQFGYLGFIFAFCSLMRFRSFCILLAHLLILRGQFLFECLYIHLTGCGDIRLSGSHQRLNGCGNGVVAVLVQTG